MCRYCERRPHHDGIWGFSRADNSVVIADSRWTELRAGVNKEGQLVIYASGEDTTEDFLPTYCPWCGRLLHKINDKGEWEDV